MEIDGYIDMGIAKVFRFRDQKSIENNTREYILSKRMRYFVTENRSRVVNIFRTKLISKLKCFAYIFVMKRKRIGDLKDISASISNVINGKS